LLQYFWLTDSAPKAPNKTLRQAAKRYWQCGQMSIPEIG